MFFALAAAIAVVDQIVKRYIVDHYEFNTPVPLVGDWLRVVLIQNSGGLFGLFQRQVQAFAVVSVVVVVFLVTLEIRSGWRSWITTLALGLLFGGAIGNFIDRVTLGYVRDFFDLGVGGWRWYIFNVADAAISVAICLLFLIAFIAPHSVYIGEPGDEAPKPRTGGDVRNEAAADAPSPERTDA